MKKNLLLPLLCFLFQHLTALAQDPILLELAHHKTTSLIFPSAIKSVDRGSRDILAQIPAGAENILQVKAARPGMGETNLTVITADGHLFSFDVRYAARPLATRFALEPPPVATGPVRFPGTGLHREQLKALTGQLAEDVRFYHGIAHRAGGVKATLEGIYIHGNTLFFRLVLVNHSPLPYDLDFVRFSVRDRKQARRTARQEAELTPLYVHGDEDRHLGAGQRRVLVFALEKFTMAPDKTLQVGFFEQRGDRHLPLRIRGRHLLDACPLRLVP